MLSYIDTHCHLDLFQDIKKSVKIEDELPIKTITVTNAPFIWRHNELLFRNCHNIRPALGLHPQLAVQHLHEIELFKTLSRDVKYIGEIGLDGSINHKGTRIEQLKIFQQIINALVGLDKKILTIHSRNAAEKTTTELKTALRNTNHQVIMHWFSGTPVELNLAIKEDFYFSINHKMIYSKKGNEIIKNIPADKILTETDAPFTFDDKIINRQQSLNLTIQGLASLWNMSYQEAKSKVYLNFKNLLNR